MFQRTSVLVFLLGCGPVAPPVEVDAGQLVEVDAGVDAGVDCTCPDGGEIIVVPLCGKLCGLE